MNSHVNIVLIAPGTVTSLHVRPSNITLYGLDITWGPSSGSNYPTPVTYRVRYRERPSSGPPGSWSSTVVRSATQREYTTPTLKPGTRYEVEVWAVTSIGKGKKETTFGMVADRVKSEITVNFRKGNIYDILCHTMCYACTVAMHICFITWYRLGFFHTWTCGWPGILSSKSFLCKRDMVRTN